MPSRHDPSLGLSLSYGENDDNERAEVSQILLSLEHVSAT